MISIITMLVIRGKDRKKHERSYDSSLYPMSLLDLILKFNSPLRYGCHTQNDVVTDTLLPMAYTVISGPKTCLHIQGLSLATPLA
jgi:hypothetical protein